YKDMGSIPARPPPAQRTGTSPGTGFCNFKKKANKPFFPLQNRAFWFFPCRKADPAKTKNRLGASITLCSKERH
ncbi:MAG: hypothetical protein WC367_02280, partial [Methanoregula sp.]